MDPIPVTQKTGHTREVAHCLQIHRLRLRPLDPHVFKKTLAQRRHILIPHRNLLSSDCDGPDHQTGAPIYKIVAPNSVRITRRKRQYRESGFVQVPLCRRWMVFDGCRCGEWRHFLVLVQRGVASRQAKTETLQRSLSAHPCHSRRVQRRSAISRSCSRLYLVREMRLNLSTLNIAKEQHAVRRALCR